MYDKIFGHKAELFGIIVIFCVQNVDNYVFFIHYFKMILSNDKKK